MYGNVNRKKHPDGGYYKDYFYYACKYACKHRKLVDGHRYINFNGEIENKISKNYLYGVEDNFFEPWTEAEVIQVKGFCIGVGICFDSAHSQHIKSLKSKGMDIFIGSSLYGKGKIEMTTNYSQISSEYKILSAVVNYAQKTGQWISCGNSSFYDTNGKIYKNLEERDMRIYI